MKRAVLIEDRPERQRIFLERKNVNLNQFDVLNNVNGESKPERLKTEFQDVANIEKTLSDYEIIMTHRSAWDSEVRMSLREYCEREQKALVYFSGGISSTTFFQKQKFQFLTMNSGDFYGSQLPLFLESLDDDSPVNLRILAFGGDWQFELLAKLRMRLMNSIEVDKLPANNKSLKDESLVIRFISSFGLEDSYIINLIRASEFERKDEILSKLSPENRTIKQPDYLIKDILELIKFEMQQQGFVQ